MPAEGYPQQKRSIPWLRPNSAHDEKTVLKISQVKLCSNWISLLMRIILARSEIPESLIMHAQSNPALKIFNQHPVKFS